MTDPRRPVSIVLVVHNQLALTRACVESLQRTSRSLELCVVDNGSTDETEAYFESGCRDLPLRYHRNADNLGLIRALNQGAALARGELVCFLHNDTEMLDPRWLAKLEAALDRDPGIGLAGLYGSRAVHADGSFVGRTIVHSLAEGPTMPRPVVEVAVVDGVCLFLSRAVLAEVGGFDEGYGFLHGYDRDLSFAVRATGRRCAVVESRFLHHCGGTRKAPDAPFDEASDLAQRRAAMSRFLGKWGRRLPVDVRGLGERLAERVRLAAAARGLRRPPSSRS